MTTTPNLPNLIKPTLSPIVPPTWNDRVTTCDNLSGRISFVWTTKPNTPDAKSKTYYRISFPPGSPYFDDWAVYRESEITIIKKKP